LTFIHLKRETSSSLLKRLQLKRAHSKVTSLVSDIRFSRLCSKVISGCFSSSLML